MAAIVRGSAIYPLFYRHEQRGKPAGRRYRSADPYSAAAGALPADGGVDVVCTQHALRAAALSELFFAAAAAADARRRYKCYTEGGLCIRSDDYSLRPDYRRGYPPGLRGRAAWTDGGSHRLRPQRMASRDAHSSAAGAADYAAGHGEPAYRDYQGHLADVYDWPDGPHGACQSFDSSAYGRGQAGMLHCRSDYLLDFD